MKKLAGPNVEFAGFKQWNEIKRIVGQARFCVIPSECYENNPLSVIESQCLGTPVLGAQIGGIPELIQEGCNGLHFRSRDTDDLTAKIQAMYDAPFDYPSIALEAKNATTRKHTINNSYSYTIYNSTLRFIQIILSKSCLLRISRTPPTPALS